MTTLCLCDWVDVDEDRQRTVRPPARVAVLAHAHERDRNLVRTDVPVHARHESIPKDNLQPQAHTT